ncbi:MAG: Rieske (2Fe-2S) protein [Myxococcales bacterium]|jgi:Rieske Fe-S protein|nr:Rieske (2Fe-2S) protein [Myxococcales bacterium]
MEESRRRFLARIGTTAAAGCILATLGGCSDGEGQSPATGPVPAGNVKDLAKGTVKFVSGKPVILGRDDQGVYALSSICTHDQCDMSKNGTIGTDTIQCDCHGSRFDKNGKVTKGPASSDLDHYKVEIAANGDITVQASEKVAATARTAVPG